MKNNIYLFYRFLKAFGNRMVFLFFGILPVVKNKMVFCSIEGQCGYSCNPKYVADEVIRRKDGFELIWLVNDMERRFPPEIKKVKNTLWNRAYHLSTAKVWIDNSRKSYGTRKRKNQMYIQTWHATIALKPVGKRRKQFPAIAYRISENDSRMADYILTDSEWCDERYPDMLLTCGNTLRIGAPRNDILVRGRGERRSAVRRQFNIPEDAKILMYAPTFRGGSQKSVRKVYAGDLQLDLSRLRRNVEKKFGGRWHIFVRLHPQLAARHVSSGKSNQAGVIDVSYVDDMNSILAGMDAFVTDYSSAAFDAALTGMPVFLFADDIKEFVQDRGELFWDLNELPFPFADTNDRLEQQIMSFDPISYQESLKTLFETVKLVEDGHAGERVVDMIERYIQTNEKCGREYEVLL